MERVRAAWIGNVMMGSARCFHRAVEHGSPRSIEVIDYSNLTMSLALTAGALFQEVKGIRTWRTAGKATSSVIVVFTSPRAAALA